MTTVTIIGAGSTVFAAELVTDFLLIDALEGGEFRLVDINANRLALAHRFAEHLIAESGKAWTVNSSVDRTTLLAGSDVVINTIEVAGLANVRHDYEIPLRYGVDQCIGDTIGPGGLFKSLRTIPVFLEILADIERLAPDALVLNHTNPMSMTVLAASRVTSMPVYGMCHSVHYTIENIADYLEVDKERLKFRSAGVNHLAWITELTLDGKDAYPLLRERGKIPEIWEQDPVRFELMYGLGAFPTESSGHVSEYVPYFRSLPTNLAMYTRPEYRGESGFYARNWPQWRRDGDAHLESIVSGAKTWDWERSGEYPSHIIEARLTGVPTSIYVNLPNDGWISNLPEGGVVEVEAIVDTDGIHPQPYGDLPPQMASWDRRHLEFHDLAVTSLLEEDRESAVQALMIDPLTSAVAAPRQIRSMFDEMVDAQRDYLPAYLS